MNADYNPVLDDDDDEVVSPPASTSKPLEGRRITIPSEPDPEDFFDNLTPVTRLASTSKPLENPPPSIERVTPAEAERLANDLQPLVESQKATELAEHKRDWGITPEDEQQHEALLEGTGQSVESVEGAELSEEGDGYQLPEDGWKPRTRGKRVRDEERKRPYSRRASRFKLLPQDYKIMDYLDVCRYAPTEFLGILTGNPSNARRRAEALESFGYIQKHLHDGRRPLWTLTKKGKEAIGSELDRTDEFGPLGIAHTLRANRFIAQLAGGAKFNGHTWTLEEGIFTERELQRAMLAAKFFAQRNTLSASNLSDAGAWQVLTKTKAERMAAFSEHGGAPPEEELGEEWLFGIYTRRGSYHYPDLVLRRERAGAAPRSLAIEFELSRKSPKAVAEVLEKYKDEFERGVSTYSHVVYIVRDKYIANVTHKAAKAAGFPSAHLVVKTFADLGLTESEV